MIAVAILVGAVIVAAPLALIARNIYVLQQEIRYIFDLWQDHDVRWRRS